MINRQIIFDMRRHIPGISQPSWDEWFLTCLNGLAWVLFVLKVPNCIWQYCQNCISKNLKVFRLKISILGLRSLMFNCSLLSKIAQWCRVLPSTAERCGALPSAAQHCQLLPSTAEHCPTLPSAAEYCQALPSAAEHCQALLSTAEPCQPMPNGA